MTLLHFIALIWHVRGIGAEKTGIQREILKKTFCSRERKNPRLQNNPNPEFDHEPDTGGREKEALFMPSILEKPSKNSSFLDKKGPGNIAKIDRISSYLPQEHRSYSCSTSSSFCTLQHIKKYPYASERVLLKQKNSDQLFRNKWA